MTLTEGQPVPPFDLPTDGGSNVSNETLKGRTVVLFFYPKADTPGCTNEAKDFTALAADFASAGAVVIGVSKDPVKKLQRFKEKHDLNVQLASDETTGVTEAFGLWVEKSMYGKTYMGIERATVLIDGDGIVRRVWRKVSVKGHAAEVLEAVRAL
jgi:peroxiredoxin Q/BCP